MKKFKIKTSFVNPKGPRENKIGNKLMIFILIFEENCPQFGAIHDFSVYLGTGSNPPTINRFQSYTGK